MVGRRVGGGGGGLEFRRLLPRQRVRTHARLGAGAKTCALCAAAAASANADGCAPPAADRAGAATLGPLNICGAPFGAAGRDACRPRVEEAVDASTEAERLRLETPDVTTSRGLAHNALRTEHAEGTPRAGHGGHACLWLAASSARASGRPAPRATPDSAGSAGAACTAARSDAGSWKERRRAMPGECACVCVRGGSETGPRPAQTCSWES